MKNKQVVAALYKRSQWFTRHSWKNMAKHTFCVSHLPLVFRLNL